MGRRGRRGRRTARARTNVISGFELQNKPAHALPLAKARQRQENQKENQAGHSPERAFEEGQHGATTDWKQCW